MGAIGFDEGEGLADLPDLRVRDLVRIYMRELWN